MYSTVLNNCGGALAALCPMWSSGILCETYRASFPSLSSSSQGSGKSGVSLQNVKEDSSGNAKVVHDACFRPALVYFLGNLSLTLQRQYIPLTFASKGAIRITTVTTESSRSNSSSHGMPKKGHKIHRSQDTVLRSNCGVQEWGRMHVMQGWQVFIVTCHLNAVLLPPLLFYKG